MGLEFGLIFWVKLSAWVVSVLETKLEVVTIRREAMAALPTRVEFLYAGCMDISRYSLEAGATPMF